VGFARCSGVRSQPASARAIVRVRRVVFIAAHPAKPMPWDASFSNVGKSSLIL